MQRLHPAWFAFGGSTALLTALFAALYWDTDAETTPAGPPLFVYVAEALRGPMEAIKRDYEQEHGQKVFLHFGPSQTILTNLQVSKKGDLFFPADDSFIELAQEKGLVRDVIPVARMQAVAVARPNFPRPFQTWDDFLAPKNTIGLANPDAAAITKLLRAKLTETGHWAALEKRRPTEMVNVNDVANAVRLGSVDVGIVWDVTAKLHPTLPVARPPELNPVAARVQIALTKFSEQPDAALRFARYLRAADKGAPHFRERGFSDVVEAESAGGAELVFYAGAMLRPAVEETLNEFERRENVHITRVYNGCGILVSQMKTGTKPDVYFACDPRFMEQVQDQFEPASNVSNNQLVIAVRKGNPHGIQGLRDLGKPGLKVGVGHEQQCALGTLTKESFIRTGLYAAVTKNVVVQSPTGDFLINQLRSGTNRSNAALDAVVVYRSNVVPFADELDAVPVTGIPCAAPQQPVAVSKTTGRPELSRRLLDALQSAESRARFEKFGFGWERQ